MIVFLLCVVISDKMHANMCERQKKKKKCNVQNETNKLFFIFNYFLFFLLKTMAPIGQRLGSTIDFTLLFANDVHGIVIIYVICALLVLYYILWIG
jgi:Mn2+/Fe2+ NRAMP family transporter